MAQKPGVMIYFDWRPCLNQLSKSEKAALLDAILDYSEFGTVPDFGSGKLGVAWGFLRPKLDRDKEAYARKVQQRKYAVYVRESKKCGTPPLPFEEWLASMEDGNHRETSDDTISYPTTTSTSTSTTTSTSTRENCCVTGAVKPPRQPPRRLVPSQRGEFREAVQGRDCPPVQANRSPSGQLRAPPNDSNAPPRFQDGAFGGWNWLSHRGCRGG